MSITAATIVSNAQALLNDQGGQLYLLANMLPHIKQSLRELGDELVQNGVPVVKEADTLLTVAANTTSIGFTGGVIQLPADLIVPIRVAERPSGSTQSFLDMDETEWTDDETPLATLNKWNWREQQIKLLGANSSNEIRLYYLKSLPTVAAGGDVIDVVQGENFLSSRTAGLCARYIGQNASIADQLDAQAGYHLDGLIRTAVLNMQKVPKRRWSPRR